MDNVFDHRANTQMAEVLSIQDDGQVQTATVRTSAGAIYSGVEVVQNFGVATRAPVDGAVAMILAAGGDPANMRAILANPSYRFGKQQPGESTLYAPDGTRVSVRVGGVVDIIGAYLLNVHAPHVTIFASAAVEVFSPQVTVTGNVKVIGDLQVTGAITH